jgi:hypothetical protein
MRHSERNARAPVVGGQPNGSAKRSALKSSAPAMSYANAKARSWQCASAAATRVEPLSWRIRPYTWSVAHRASTPEEKEDHAAALRATATTTRRPLRRSCCCALDPPCCGEPPTFGFPTHNVFATVAVSDVWRLFGLSAVRSVATTSEALGQPCSVCFGLTLSRCSKGHAAAPRRMSLPKDRARWPQRLFPRARRDVAPRGRSSCTSTAWRRGLPCVGGGCGGTQVLGSVWTTTHAFTHDDDRTGHRGFRCIDVR